MTIHDLDDVWGSDLTPIEIRAWEEGTVGDKVYWKGTFENLWKCEYRNFIISDIYIDQLTCGLVVSVPACDLEDNQDEL